MFIKLSTTDTKEKFNPFNHLDEASAIQLHNEKLGDNWPLVKRSAQETRHGLTFRVPAENVVVTNPNGGSSITLTPFAYALGTAYIHNQVIGDKNWVARLNETIRNEEFSELRKALD